MSGFLLIICNNTAKDVNCTWIRPNGEEIFYKTIPSCDYYEVNTYESHVWRFSFTASGSTIRTYTACKQPFGQLVDVVEHLDPPEELTCDISCQLMCDPVKASDGHVYDLSTLHKIFQVNGLSPFTREPLSRTMILQREISAACAAYCEDHDCIHLSHQALYESVGLCEHFRLTDTSPSQLAALLNRLCASWF